MTYSGEMVGVDFGVPTLDDISLALSRITRFGGHCRSEWSVLQHSLVCATLAASAGSTPRAVLAALLHDAHEAITSDVPSPVKPDGLKATQAKLDKRIMDELFPGGYAAYLVEDTHAVDFRALIAEAVTVGPPRITLENVEELFGGRPPAADMLVVRMVQGMTEYPLDARLVFHERYQSTSARIR